MSTTRSGGTSGVLGFRAPLWCKGFGHHPTGCFLPMVQLAAMGHDGIHNTSCCPHTPLCPLLAHPTFSSPCWANSSSLAQVEVPGLVPTNTKV